MRLQIVPTGSSRYRFAPSLSHVPWATELIRKNGNRTPPSGEYDVSLGRFCGCYETLSLEEQCRHPQRHPSWGSRFQKLLKSSGGCRLTKMITSHSLRRSSTSLRRQVSFDSHVVDSTVMLFFLLAKEENLLGDLLGWPLRVPFAVYDPEEPQLQDTGLRSELLSDLRQAVSHFQRTAGLNGDRESLLRVSRIDALHADGRLAVEALSNREQRLVARLQGRRYGQSWITSTPKPRRSRLRCYCLPTQMVACNK